jgi:hypothetical protein
LSFPSSPAFWKRFRVLCEARKGGESLFDLNLLGEGVKQAAPGGLEETHGLLPLVFTTVRFEEALEQPGALLRAARQLRDLVLPEDLDARRDLGRRKRERLPLGRLDGRRAGQGAFDQVLAPGGVRRPQQQRDLGAAAQDVLHKALVRSPGLLADRSEAQHRADALHHSRLARTSAAHEHVEVLVDADRGAVQEAARPLDREELGVLLRLGVAGELDASDSGSRSACLTPS